MDADAAHYLILNISSLLFFLKNSFWLCFCSLSSSKKLKFHRGVLKGKKYLIVTVLTRKPTDWYTSDSYKDQIRMKFIYIIRDIEVQIIVSY